MCEENLTVPLCQRPATLAVWALSAQIQREVNMDTVRELVHCVGCDQDTDLFEPWVVDGELSLYCPDCSEIAEMDGHRSGAKELHRLEIWKRWKGNRDQLVRSNLPANYFQTTIEEFIRHVELAGIKKETAFELLVTGELVHTPWALYATVEFVEKDR
jgi:hypothetical protein